MKKNVVLASVFLAACSSQLPGGATYDLVTANGKPLPYLLKEEAGCRHVLEGGSVVLDGRKGYHSAFDIRIFCADSTKTVPDPGVTGRLQLKNDTMFFLDRQGNRTGSGVLTADSLIVGRVTQRLGYVRRRSATSE